MILKRKKYNDLLKWKNLSQGKSVLLFEGARRVGKSTLVKEFGKNEYKSYLIIDFDLDVDLFKSVINSRLRDLDNFFFLLSSSFGVPFFERNTLIVFDEIQLYPLARQALKHLVKDGRYDYIEIGSLISLKKNTKNILIPSEEEKITLNLLDFQEFLWATTQNFDFAYLEECYKNKKPLGEVIHQKILKSFRLYMLLGGMPGVIREYLETNSYERVEEVKKSILGLYRNDIHKANNCITKKIQLVFESIPTQLAKSNKKFAFSEISPDTSNRYFYTAFKWLEESKMINLCESTNLPTFDLKSNIDHSRKKIYFLDTGLLITLACQNNITIKNDVFKLILDDKFHINERMFFENLIAQQLVASGKELIYYYGKTKEESKNYYEVDFIIHEGKFFSLIEVKSSNYQSHISLDQIKSKFSKYLNDSCVISNKDLRKESNTVYLPAYLTYLL